MVMSRADILAIDDLNTKIVNIPKWGDVKIKSLSINDQIEFEKINAEKKSDSDVIFKMLLLCCIDDNNKPLFEESDLPALKNKSSVAMLKLFKECLDLNSLNEHDLENKAKNS